LPKRSGVYVFLDDEEEVLYVGKAVNLQERVRSYFSSAGDGREKVARMVKLIVEIGWIEVISEFEALLLEARLINKFQPKYNSIARDDKNPLYVVVTREEYPKVRLVRKQDEVKGEWFGPFQSGFTARRLVKRLRKIVPFCTCRRDKGRPCLYASIGYCKPSPREVIKMGDEKRRKELRAKYLRNIGLLRRLLKGKTELEVRKLEQEMDRLSKREEYEGAAELRDVIGKLRMLVEPGGKPWQYLDNPRLALELRRKSVDGLLEMLVRLGLQVEKKEDTRRIEGYDVSNLAGKWITGAMVVFEDGLPNLSEYRRFRIKKQGWINDVGAMGEVLSRRFSRDGWRLPDLVMVDGGKGQVGRAREVLSEKDLSIPVVGLAKRREELWVKSGDGYKKVRLRADSLMLQLVKHIRDEAHRFAKKYHVGLRRREMGR
jgi:excinuclease ABC subunit C